MVAQVNEEHMPPLLEATCKKWTLAEVKQAFKNLKKKKSKAAGEDEISSEMNNAGDNTLHHLLSLSNEIWVSEVRLKE